MNEENNMLVSARYLAFRKAWEDIFELAKESVSKEPNYTYDRRSLKEATEQIAMLNYELMSVPDWDEHKKIALQGKIDGIKWAFKIATD